MSKVQKYRFGIRFIQITVVCMVCHSMCFGQFNWEWRNPLPQGNYHLRAVEYGNNKYVAVGSFGTVLESPDGLTWKRFYSGTKNGLASIVYAQSQFLIVGAAGTILCSSDGVTWSEKNSNTTKYLNRIACVNSLFVAVGDSGTILTSPDGSAWSISKSVTSKCITSLTYAQNKFVAVGDSGIILSSSNGLAWEVVTSVTTQLLTSVTYGNNLFVATSFWAKAIFTSPDGTIWTKANTIEIWPLEATCAQNKFVVVGAECQILTSTDGLIWTERYKESDAMTLRDLRCVTYANNQFVAAGAYGTIMTSKDAMNWSPISSGPLDPFQAVAYGNNCYMALNFARPWTSPDGAIWSKQNRLPYGTAVNHNTFLTFGNNRFLALSYGAILTSPDGVSWKTLFTFSNELMSAAYGNNQFIVVGAYYYSPRNGLILSVTKDTVVNEISLASMKYNRLNAVAYGNNMFVIVGDTGTILTSSDCVTWKKTIYGSWCSCYYSVAYGNGRFVVAENNGDFIWSTDGITWKDGASGLSRYSKTLAFGNGQFVAVGSDSIIHTSVDGITWIKQFEIPRYLYSVAYGNKQFVAAGDYGTILSSDDSIADIKQKKAEKPVISNLIIKRTRNSISVVFPDFSYHEELKFGLYNGAGKLIYSASARISNGILNIPADGFSSGVYFLSVADGHNSNFSVFFVLQK